MILVFDTSGKDLNIGLAGSDGVIIDSFHHTSSMNERGVHDRMLATETNNLLRRHSLTADRITRIGFINGPGSFTGLRIGLAFAKGFAFGSNAQLVPLIAHEVIMQSALRLKPEIDVDAIVVNGYEKSSVYYATLSNINSVILRKINEIEKDGQQTLVGSNELSEVFSSARISFIPIPIDLKVMVECCLSSQASKSIASLEPFYGTDFKPHPSALTS